VRRGLLLRSHGNDRTEEAGEEGGGEESARQEAESRAQEGGQEACREEEKVSYRMASNGLLAMHGKSRSFFPFFSHLNPILISKYQ
jgi:hypothetical protein